MKRVIITGGSGQMGRALAANLAKDGVTSRIVWSRKSAMNGGRLA